MNSQPVKTNHAGWDHTPPRISAAFGAKMPPKPPSLAMAAGNARKPTLTETFNHAADPRVQIALLQAKMSRPVPTLDFSFKGSVVRSINPQRDRAIQKQIAALSKAIAKPQQQAPVQKFDLKTSNQVTPTFNLKARPR